MATVSELIEERFGVKPEGELNAIAEGTIEKILSRRSHRKYTSEPIPDDVLETLLACAQSAPAKSDLQQFSIIKIKDEDLRQSIFNLNPSTHWFAEAPVALVFCGDMRRGQRLTKWKGHDHGNNTVDTFMNASVDAALAMMNFITAAESIGLGCCPVSNIRVTVNEISELLGLPEGVFPIAGLGVGYPEDAPLTSMRLPPALVIHEDRYDDADLETELAAYDARRNQRRSIPPEKQMHKDTFGISEQYGWSENTARRLALQERNEFTAYIKSQGFKLG